jgi:hypothetical protein
MKNFIRKNLVLIIFCVTGTVAGFLYWKFVGCLSGTCMIKSKWYLSTLYGALLGYLTGSLAEDLIIRIKKGFKH